MSKTSHKRKRTTADSPSSQRGHSPSPTSSASGESSALASPQHQQGAEGPPPSYDPFVANPTASVGNEGSSSAAPSLTLSTTKTIDRLPTDLECVEDDFEEGAHEKLDEWIRQLSRHITPQNIDDLSGPLLATIVAHSGSALLQKYSSITDCEAIIESEPRLRNMLLDGSKNGFKSVRLLKLLRPQPTLKHDSKRLEASTIQKAWNVDYVGNGVNLLWAHIGDCYNMRTLDGNRHFYAKYCAIVQSSGMGKSRTVDEMSKSHFVIPVNLREHDSTGYPPPDGPARDYLTGSATQIDAFLRSCSFLHGLFVQTVTVLKDIKEPTAEKFWNYMKEGMEFGAHGPHRQEFYQKVKTLAEGFYTHYSEYFPSEKSPSEAIVDQMLLDTAFPLRKAFKELCKALGDEVVPELSAEQPTKKRRTSNPKSQASKHPLVVLAFDEAHTLTEPQDKGSWSCFGEMRRAIRGLHTLSFFTLFISTSGTLFGITPTTGRNISARMLLEGEVMSPFCEVGFDKFAKYVDFRETVKLSQITSEEHLTSYGRPLFTLDYRQGQKDHIFLFAAQKLLGGIAYEFQALTIAEKFAFLAQRIPIEFLSATYASQVSDLEMEQVRSHMRVVLEVDHSLETMVTMSPSEPVLSEAAYFVMTTQPQFSPPEALQVILNEFPVNKGELGELIVTLLFTMARDEAVGPANNFGRPPDNQRWCSLTELLTSLFCTPSPPSKEHVDVVTSKGWHFTAGCPDQTKTRSSLGARFKNSKVYFTHFVKVHEQALVHVEYLMRLMVRGAALLCTNGDLAVDGIIPFLFEGDEIRPDNIGVIMFQVMNDATYSSSPEFHLFHAMDPFSLKILEPPTKVPIIRIVFAPAAKTPSFKLVNYNTKKRRPRFAPNESFTTYDFWVSGLSPKILVPVENEQSAWDSILEVSSSWERIYSDSLAPRTTQRRSMNPGVAVPNEFWGNWCNSL